MYRNRMKKKTAPQRVKTPELEEREEISSPPNAKRTRKSSESASKGISPKAVNNVVNASRSKKALTRVNKSSSSDDESIPNAQLSPTIATNRKSKATCGSSEDDCKSPKSGSKRKLTARPKSRRVLTRHSSSEDEVDELMLQPPLANSTQRSPARPPRGLRLGFSQSNIKPYYEEVLLMSGFHLRDGDSLNFLDKDQAAFVLKFESEIQKNGRVDINIAEFMKGFETYISEPHNLKRSLDTTETDNSCTSARQTHQACLIRLLLLVECIQPKLMAMLFEIVVDMVCSGNCKDDKIFMVIQQILRQMRFLDCLVDGPLACDQLLSLIELADSVNVKREVITLIPYIISDTEHERAALALSEVLSANPNVIPAILDSLDNLKLSSELLDTVMCKVLDILDHAPLDHQGIIMKFLTSNAKEMRPVIEVIRKNVNLDPKARGSDESVGVLFANNLKDAALNSPSIVDTWLNVLSNGGKLTFLPIDVVALLVFYENCLGRKKISVLNVVKQHALLGLEADKAIDNAIPLLHKVILHHMDTTLLFASAMLCAKDSATSQHASIWFGLLVEHFQNPDSQKVINELLGHVGCGTPAQASLALGILSDAARKNIDCLAPYAHQLLGLLDRMDNWDLSQVRQVMLLLCHLAYRCSTTTFLQDDIIMMVRKQISSSIPM